MYLTRETLHPPNHTAIPLFLVFNLRTYALMLCRYSFMPIDSDWVGLVGLGNPDLPIYTLGRSKAARHGPGKSTVGAL